VVTTDTGHKGGSFDSSFTRDQQAALDFAYQAIGRVAVLAKQVVGFYYGKGPQRSYYTGCSTGGREAMIMSQRYPSYFDGIISGAPAMRTGHSNLALAFVGATFANAVPADASGRRDPKLLLSDSDRQLVIDALLAKCDEKDGLKDGMIFNQLACDFDPTALVCKGPKAAGCLSEAQATAVKTAFAGPKTSAGDQVYTAFPYDVGITEKRGLPGLLLGPSIPVRGATSGNAVFNTDKEAERIDRDANARLGDSTWTNLGAFAGHGGKLVFFHGVSDPWFSAFETLAYYKKMSSDTPGANADSWSRFYLVPGMGHCAGGSAALDQFDLLTPLVNWVEKSEPPQRVIATGSAFPGRSRPLCPYPEHTRYKGQGETNDAGNFTCEK
jgi:feruloyl esterase